MTMPRKLLVDVNVSRFYHLYSRCVRGALLCGEGFEHRKQWIEDRLQLLAGQFAISVCGFAVMDNHFHVLVRLDPAAAKEWSAEEVVQRWVAVYPPKSLDVDDPSIVEKWVKHHAKDKKRVDVLRERLENLGWFMKALKEPLARLANKADGCSGTFWEGRYKSIAVLDEESLLATCAYIDLNPVAAGIASTPEASKHTSLRQRVQHAKECGKLDALKAAAKGSYSGSKSAGRFEDAHWLCPLDDGQGKGSPREGMLAGFSLGSYLLLVDYTGRLHREGKARLPSHLKGIFERLGTSSGVWETKLKKMLEAERLIGNHFSSSRDRLRDLAQQKGVHHL
ncbi:MAG TPA: hypothetical protein PKD54_04305, partial [Pirellulaceae bacterium]|nr:hypothetical protein [Pirellulaceae bacterium]